MLTQRHTARIYRESWDSAFARGMHNPGRLLKFREPHRGSRFSCVHRWFISAGDTDDVDIVFDTSSRSFYVVCRNAHFGYCRVERFDLDGSTDAAFDIFEQNNPEETFGKNWVDAHPRTIINRIAEYEACSN